eukprot:TRINITY_DN10035_c0_g1_i1.p1 TRINITY_DN10035_c0_g1~~TRINITY_DN10035_c0_g1_i1.p1  ORF type:complete len:112 (+),score=12.05 TRINITY_DN10035_c0_g1_i1:572-907(+)
MEHSNFLRSNIDESNRVMMDLLATEWYHHCASFFSTFNCALSKPGWVSNEEEIKEYVIEVLHCLRADSLVNGLCDKEHLIKLLQGREPTGKLKVYVVAYMEKWKIILTTVN